MELTNRLNVTRSTRTSSSSVVLSQIASAVLISIQTELEITVMYPESFAITVSVLFGQYEYGSHFLPIGPIKFYRPGLTCSSDPQLIFKEKSERI